MTIPGTTTPPPPAHPITPAEEIGLLRAALTRAVSALKLAEETISRRAESNALADIRATIVSIQDTPGV